MNLDEFTKRIEYELRGYHTLSSETIIKLNDIVDSQMKSPPSPTAQSITSAFEPTLVSTIISTINDIKPSIQQQIINSITNTAHQLFPNHPTLYLAYALVKLNQERQTFLTQLLDSTIQSFDKAKQLWLHIFIYVGTILTIVGIIILIVNHYRKHPIDKTYSTPI